MKKFVVPLLLLVFMADSAGAQWQKIHEFTYPDGQYMEGISCIYFLDLPGPPRIGFVGTVPEMWMTTDGGKSWSNSWHGTYLSEQFPSGICFKDSLTGWFAFQSSTSSIFRTRDGGLSWTSLSIPEPSSPVSDIHYCEATGKLFLGNGDTLFVSNDFGNTWNFVLPASIGKFSFSTDSTGITSAWLNNGKVSTILRTTNGGISWLQSDASLPDSLGYDGPLAVVNSGTCYAVSAGRIRVFRSDNYGESWKLLKDFGPNIDSHFNETGPVGTGQIGGVLSRLCIQSDSGLFISTDQGDSWALDAAAPRNGVFCIDKGEIFASMSVGSLANFDGSLWEEVWPNSGVKENAPANTDSFAVRGPYSNPSDPGADDVSILVHYCGTGSTIAAQVYDGLGNPVGSASTYTSDGQTWDRLPIYSPLTAGSYTVQVSVGAYFTTLGYTVY